MNKKNVAVLFGGRAPEHEISIITGVQTLNALSKDKYNVVPVYISKSGEWILGNKSFWDPKTFKNLERAAHGKERLILSQDPTYNKFLFKPSLASFLKGFALKEKIDIFFPVFHGRYGEDGSLQGLFELADVAYVGCDVQASSIGMDKIVSKRIAKSIGIPVLSDMFLFKSEWERAKGDILKRIYSSLGYPVFVKPSRLGSSIGIVRARNRDELIDAIESCFFYDSRVLVEKALVDAVEVNISILGNNPYQLSATEQPVASGEILSFKDKYISEEGVSKGMASAKRLVPAPIGRETEQKISKYAESFFREIGGQGIARIDFLLSKDKQRIYFNEINTIPGSLAFYLWKKKKVSFSKLLDRLIELGFERYNSRKNITNAFESNVLSGFEKVGGVKKI